MLLFVTDLGEAADGWSIWQEGLERQLMTKAWPRPIMPSAQIFKNGLADRSLADVGFQRAAQIDSMRQFSEPINTQI